MVGLVTDVYLLCVCVVCVCMCELTRSTLLQESGERDVRGNPLCVLSVSSVCARACLLCVGLFVVCVLCVCGSCVFCVCVFCVLCVN